MLNYIWISLIVIGILVAAGNDVRDEVQNTYRNGGRLMGGLVIKKSVPGVVQIWEADMIVRPDAFNEFYGVQSATSDVHQLVTITVRQTSNASIALLIGDDSQPIWKEMVKSSSAKDKLTGKIKQLNFSPDGTPTSVQFELEPIHFVKMKAITQAALDIAGTAVNIALGLIGILAMWLGVMKVAEEAGLLKVLTRLLTPITKRLFPDVPADHPAVGAMIMNVAANMLGLSNAATPFGLKAMEELNKLNPKAGTATNAMVTFLAINTGGLVLIPATAIAVRATVGSANPGIIIGTSIIGAACATIAGVVASKVLQRLPRYKKEMEVSNG